MKNIQKVCMITCMVSVFSFFCGSLGSYAMDAAGTDRVGQVTEYIDEGGEKRTIYWADHITPPKMGGGDSEFQKHEYEQGGTRYVEYIAPYTAGNGWYDVNKTPDQTQDANLCFSAAAANTLHWWLDQNTTYIDRYLAAYPEAPKAEEIRELKGQTPGQHDSKIYARFVEQFANRTTGNWPDILQDQFINGYPPKENGGTNDPEYDGKKLMETGPDKRGGFFYPVFGPDILTQRRFYDFTGNYQSISADMKQFFEQGQIVTLTYKLWESAHVVTVWGAEYDSAGNLSGVYFSDSDDMDEYGMHRYRVVNKKGQAYVTTDMSDDGGGSPITCLTTLSTGTRYWEKVLTPTELELVWGDTQFVYNGSPQIPTLTAGNIADGDDAWLSVKGEGVEVGTYSASAMLSGNDAGKYSLPAEDAGVSFVITQSGTVFEGGVKAYLGTKETTDVQYGDTITIKVSPRATGNAPDSSEPPSVSVKPTNGQVTFFAGGQKLNEAVNTDENGVYTLTYDTKKGALKAGANQLTVKFHDDKNMADHEEKLTIFVKAAEHIPGGEEPPAQEGNGEKAPVYGENGEKADRADRAVKTGDDTSGLIWMFISAGAAAVVYGLYVRNRKKA
ncbi:MULTISPECIES: IdeS/Mac family cysteine endopeptidase [Lachnospiraceae]|uniref:IdeS/Mac family cysteine endopeptidase n=1 Tax=Faecalicatena acetigenes TaxID=2981790 RepID=A0ABT2TEQ6_9FIRM|nr:MULTISPECIES: IdeS/Mac family cysteine endopeptidase [Lachnospiraceae]MCU6748476.1 IdeS/Mac family cysteine endopeptidase [Faecalicatena acetigenes]SCI46803.1 Mac 1 [uncultured Clostridium sp.]